MNDDIAAAFRELERMLDIFIEDETKKDIGGSLPERVLQKVGAFTADLERNSRLRRIVRAVDAWGVHIVELDETGNVLYVNDAGKAIVKSAKILADEAGNNNQLISHMLRHSCGEEGFPVCKEVYEHDDSRCYRVVSDVCVMPDGERRYLHIADEVTEWRQEEKQLEYIANIDTLTGALNRRAGYAFLKVLLNRPSPLPHCVVMIDIDGLKHVNDTYGHAEGDEYIRAVAECLSSSSRSNTETLVRYAGDEFFVIFQDCTPYLAKNAMRRIQYNLKEWNKQNEKPYEMSFSYGVESFGEGRFLSIEELLEAADKKMYADKAKKKANRV